MQQMERWLIVLVAILLVLVAIMVFAQYGEDGAVLFTGDAVFPSLMALMFIVYVVSQTMRDGKLIEFFERSSLYLANPMIQNEIGRRFQGLPPLPKQATNILLDLAEALADISDTPDDNELIDLLRQALDSKAESLEPKEAQENITQ